MVQAQKTEANTLRQMKTFVIIPDNFDLTGYQYVPLIYAWDVKFDGRKWARLVANGKITMGPPKAEVWSGVVSTESVRTAIFLAMLNGMKILAADICCWKKIKEWRRRLVIIVYYIVHLILY